MSLLNKNSSVEVKKMSLVAFLNILFLFFIFSVKTVSSQALINNPLVGTSNLSGFISTIVNNVILPVGGTVAAVALIYSGFLFVVAQGNETKLASAKKAFLYSVIGTAILLGSWVLSEGVAATVRALTTT